MNKLNKVLAALTIACAPIAATQASDFDKLCQGIGVLICGPGKAINAVSEAMQPPTPFKQMYSAIDAGDIPRLRQILDTDGYLVDSEGALRYAVDTYFFAPNKVTENRQLELIKYLLDERVNITDYRSSIVLGPVTRGYGTITYQRPMDTWERRLTLANLAFAHGATAKNETLNSCHDCEKDNGFLELMVSKGADPNKEYTLAPSLLHQFLLRDEFDAAERWLRLGANPNGTPQDKYSMLADLASQCDADKMRSQTPARNFEAAWTSCVSRSQARARFAVEHGADPNGPASKATKCATPYSVALKGRNTALAETLLTLGADPDAEARCLQQP